MARLVGLPDKLQQLVHSWKRGPCGNAQRLGQYVWNNYGQVGADGKTWTELFYAEHDKALKMLLTYYRE